MRLFSNDVRKSDSQVEAELRGLKARIDGLAAEMKDLLEVETASRALLLSSASDQGHYIRAPRRRFDALEAALHIIDARRDSP